MAGLARGEPVPVPTLGEAEIVCQRATAIATSTYLTAVTRAREDCFDRKLRSVIPPTIDCRASVDAGTGDPDTDRKLASARTNLSGSIRKKCRDDVDYGRLGFPGLCEDFSGPPYTEVDHVQCMLDRSNETLDELLAIRHPPFPTVSLIGEDISCQAELSGKSGSMFFKEVTRRTFDCEQKRFEAQVPASVNCRAEIDPLAPNTGDAKIDEVIVDAHDDVLRGIGNFCGRANLSRLGFPNLCPNADTSPFSVSALTECLYKTHHYPLVEFVDGMFPSTKMCGNCLLDTENGEQCDDGDNEWERGQLCRANCYVITSCGDPDDDRRITAEDALFILRSAVGIETCHPSLCDIDGDGSISAQDARRALRAAVGLPVEITCTPPPAPDLVCPGT